ncbi:MAG: methyltransferase domain-containing protein [Vicinamibacterales bacterium]
MSHDDASRYLHGTAPDEQARLSLLNDLLNVGSLRELDLRGGERILDVGSGLGQLARAMGRAAGVRVVAVERSEAQIVEADRQAALAGEQTLVEFRQGDASALPLGDDEWGSFDVAHARFLLEHLRDPLPAVQAMVRAVRPGGRIVLEDDDHDLLRLWPEPPGFRDLWRAYRRSYMHLGNDPDIGRRLFGLLVEAGAAPCRNSYVFFGSCAGDANFALYVDNLVGVVAGAGSTIAGAALLDAASIDAALRALRDWRHEPAATLWFAVSWAEGRRPV